MINNKFPIFKILILVTILAVPGFLYYLLQEKGKNRYKPLPVFGPKEVAKTFHTKKGKKIPDTIYHQIPDVVFTTTATGKSLALGELNKQLLVVNFFYTNNKTLIPKMNLYIKTLNKEFKDNKMIRFISISIDPENDNQAKLAAYGQQYGAVNEKWDVVTADTSIVYPLAKKHFFVNALKTNRNNTDFILSNQFILLDTQRRIRGYYDATSQEEVKRLSGELKVLITEELRKIPAELGKYER